MKVVNVQSWLEWECGSLELYGNVIQLAGTCESWLIHEWPYGLTKQHFMTMIEFKFQKSIIPTSCQCDFNVLEANPEYFRMQQLLGSDEVFLEGILRLILFI